MTYEMLKSLSVWNLSLLGACLSLGGALVLLQWLFDGHVAACCSMPRQGVEHSSGCCKMWIGVVHSYQLLLLPCNLEAFLWRYQRARPQVSLETWHNFNGFSLEHQKSALKDRVRVDSKFMDEDDGDDAWQLLIDSAILDGAKVTGLELTEVSTPWERTTRLGDFGSRPATQKGHSSA